MKRNVLILLFLTVIVIMDFQGIYGEELNGFTNSKLHILSSSTNNVNASATIQISQLLGNVGDEIEISISPQGYTPSFVGRTSTGNRTATYYFDKICNYKIIIDDYEYNKSNVVKRINKGGRYSVKGMVTYRWATGVGKIKAGFPKYFYKTIYTDTKIIDFTDLISVQVEKPEKDKEEVIGVVKHCELWEKRRIDLGRAENVFWPGEKFILEANVNGVKPNNVTVSIEGTDYKTELQFDGSKWRGELIDESMMNLWSDTNMKAVEFIFTAFFNENNCENRVTVYIDNVYKYWELHRKE